MSVERRAAWGALTGGLSMLVHLAVAFVLAPVLLHRLGDASYGIWVLVLSLTGYFGLFDLGVRSAVVRFTAAHHATGDREGLRQRVSSALVANTGIAAIVLLAAIAAAYLAPQWFHVPLAALSVVRAMVLVMGADAAAGFPCSVFGGVLEGLQRYAFLNFTQIAVSLGRGALIVAALHVGGGLLAITIAAVAAHLAGSCVIVGHALRLLPALSLRAGLSRGALRAMGGHSAPAFLMSIADRVRFQADALVIGVFAAPAAIAYFALAARLSDVLGNVVQMMAQVVTPASSHLHAAGDNQRMREVLLRANQACAWLMLPGAALFVLCGKSVIAFWVGERYAGIYPVFVVLLSVKAMFFSQAAAPRVLLGIGRHGRFVRLLALEAALNLLLSVALVQRWGILGVALGTALPMSVTAIALLPRLLSRVTGVSALTYLRMVYAAPAFCAVVVLLLGGAAGTLVQNSWSRLLAASMVLLVTAVLIVRFRRHVAASRMPALQQETDAYSAPPAAFQS